MEKIGIIAAMRPEMEMILDRMGEFDTTRFLGIEFNEGSINNHDIVVVECGVGKVNAAMATTLLISEFSCDFIINTGIAGGLPGVKTRDVILATGLMWHDFDIRLFGYEYGQVPHMPKVFPVNPECVMMVKSILYKLKIDHKDGIILSGDKFVSSLDTIKECQNIGALACEMEGAAIAQVALKSNVDFVVLRYISDVIGEESQNDDYLKFEDEMAKRSIEITLAIIESL